MSRARAKQKIRTLIALINRQRDVSGETKRALKAQAAAIATELERD